MEQTPTCEDCRIEISTTGIEVDSSTGNLVVEGAVVVTLLVIVCAVYAFKKWIDTWLK